MAQGTTSTTAAQREPLLVDLALQGGGAHGAFTWGAIDPLLEPQRCREPLRGRTRATTSPASSSNSTPSMTVARPRAGHPIA
jgi:hypothetical protein